jgi:hypothetical protein
MSKKNKKSASYVHTSMQYEKFVELYKMNEKDESVPSNREFSKNI